MNTTTKTDGQIAERDEHRSYISPLVDIFETKDSYILEAEMPGVAKQGLDVLLDNNQLTIVGQRVLESTGANYVYRESQPRDYRRVFELDPAIDTAKITAQMDQGVLTLVLPKADHVKPRKISVTN